MKKIILLSLAAGGLFFVLFQFASPSLAVFKPIIYVEPSRLVVPRLGIDTEVEHVGMDKKGMMDVPKNANNVAWFKPGFLPGEKGNSVIAGHYDSETGPAIFYNLSALSVGDELVIIDSAAQPLKFVVTDKKVVKENNFPIEEVFGKSNKRKLNLITCAGTFNKKTKTYSERVVIFTELKE